MSSSFYDIGRLLLVGEDQIEEVGERRQDGDLADMVRSSFNGRRGGLLYPQDHQSDISASTIYSNHHQIWSLTCTSEDHEQPQQQQDEISCVDQRGSSGQCLLDENIDVEYLHQAAAGNDPLFSTSIMMTNTTAPDHPAPHQHHNQHHNHNHNHNNMMFHPSSGIAPLENLPTTTRSSMMHHMMIKSREEAGGGGLINECVRVKPPINCNVFSQMLDISSSINDLLAPPLPSLILDQNKQQPQQAVAPPSSSSSSFTELIGIGSNSKDTDHITTNNNNISTGSNGRGIKTMLLNDDHSNRNCTITSATCFDTLLHRNPAIKRSRKSLAKKVVCIPAPSPATTRPSGEVVPSDLWAWRKYGQKPIKGSPYPRGYYRCSSSKGCSARKQVERSRTDPNMLVITYTSEHNHPWPTQRNALAGSTRSHPSKNTSTSSSSSWTGAVVIDDQMNLTSSTKDHELKPAEMVIKQQKVDEHVGASVHDYSNDQRENSSRDYEEGESWRCSYNKMTYRPRSVDQLEEYNEQSQDDDFFAELGEIAGKDHNGFSSFLMDWPSSERIHDQDKAVI